MEETPQNFNARINEEINAIDASSAEKIIGNYDGSDLQKNTYLNLENSDRMYKKFITLTYGSYENFLRSNKINEEISIFDPTTDYHLDVSVIKKDAVFKSDHLSAQELILESLSGECTVWFIKNNGSTRKVSGTLNPAFMPTSQWETRVNFFRPLANDRVGIWDTDEQAWKSFYMSRVFKFVRDDTQSIE